MIYLNNLGIKKWFLNDEKYDIIKNSKRLNHNIMNIIINKSYINSYVMSDSRTFMTIGEYDCKAYLIKMDNTEIVIEKFWKYTNDNFPVCKVLSSNYPHFVMSKTIKLYRDEIFCLEGLYGDGHIGFRCQHKSNNIKILCLYEQPKFTNEN